MTEGLSGEEIQNRFNAERNAEYVELLKEAIALRKRKEAPSTLVRKYDRLKRFTKQTREIDYFDASKGRDLEEVLRQLEEELKGKPQKDSAPALEAKDYLNRVWITRPNPEIDRCGSAWLIGKFIDPKATFRFSAKNRSAATQ